MGQLGRVFAEQGYCGGIVDLDVLVAGVFEGTDCWEDSTAHRVGKSALFRGFEVRKQLYC